MGTALLIVLGLLLPFALTDLSSTSLAEPAVGLAILITWYATARIAQLAVRGRDCLIQLTFWAFVYVWLGLAALAEVVGDQFPIPFQAFSRSTQVHALIGIFIGLIAYDVGGFLASRSRRAPWMRLKLNALELVPRRVWALAFIGILSTTYFTLAEGVAVRFSSRETATTSLFGNAPTGLRLDQVTNKAAGLVKISLLWMPAFLGLYLLVYLYRSRDGRDQGDTQQRWWSRSPATRRMIGVMAIVNVFANNPISNPRYRFGGVALALLIAYRPVATPARFRAAVVGLLGLLIVVFPYAAVFRYDERVLQLTPVKQQLVGSADFGMFQQELNGVLYVDQHGHTLGRQTLGGVLSFVPRAVWKDKPLDTGTLVSRARFINASSTLWTEANVEYGWVGIFGAFLLYGYLSRLFDEAYVRRLKGRISVVAAAVPLFAAFQIFFVRGSFQPAFGELAPVAGAFMLCVRVRRDGEPLPSHGAPAHRPAG